jgi:hypothetical protein
VKNVEEQYCRRAGLMEEEIDNIIVNARTGNSGKKYEDSFSTGSQDKLQCNRHCTRIDGSTTDSSHEGREESSIFGIRVSA